MWTERIFNVAKVSVFVAGASVISNAKIYNQIAAHAPGKHIKANLTPEKLSRLRDKARKRFLAKQAAKLLAAQQSSHVPTYRLVEKKNGRQCWLH